MTRKRTPVAVADSATEGSGEDPRKQYHPLFSSTVWMVLSSLTTTVCSFPSVLTRPLRGRVSLQWEILELRHQLTVYQRLGTKPRLKPADCLFWAWLSRVWSGWQETLVFVQPAAIAQYQGPKLFIPHFSAHGFHMFAFPVTVSLGRNHFICPSTKAKLQPVLCRASTLLRPSVG